MNVFTYYENVQGISQLDSLKLISEWREAWRNLGFEPVILNEWVARKHPMFEAFKEAIDKLPTANSYAYEFACWVRWLSLAQVGGGLFGDFDVLPRPSNPVFNANAEDVTDGIFVQIAEFDPAKLHLLQSNCVCPCLVYASTDVCVRMATEFMTGKGPHEIAGKPHFSDQYSLERMVLDGADWIVQHDLVRLYGDEGWRDRPFVHFANSAASPAGKTPRWKFVREVMS